MCSNATKRLDRDTVLEVVDTMFIYIRESSKMNNEDSFPSRSIIMGAVLGALPDIFEYQANYKINILNRDTIKLFAFAIPHLNKQIKMLRYKNFDMSDETAYVACMDLIATTYKDHVDFNKHKDMKNTCRILSELANSGNTLAGYTYIKGVQETCSCCIQDD